GFPQFLWITGMTVPGPGFSFRQYGQNHTNEQVPAYCLGCEFSRTGYTLVYPQKLWVTSGEAAQQSPVHQE
ncbi:MAG: hypothetical protein RLN92_00350, partial [Alloalcanivorax xenomutans]